MACRSRSRSPCRGLEEAVQRLNKAFTANSLDLPKDLELFLRNYHKGKDDEGRKNMYKRIYGLLWYGSRRTIGNKGGRAPTYVYPVVLKDVVRARYPSCLKQWEDPTGDNVYHVSYSDLASIKWPRK